MTYKIDFSINKDSVREHFAYAKLQYFAVVLLGFIFWQLLFTVTAYRPPKDKTLTVYIC